MTYYAVVRNNEYLVHHGIKGQKWYVRRFQNENGTLTPAGRERYGVKRYRKEAVKFQKKLDKIAQSGERDEYFREARTIPEGTIMYRTTAAAWKNGEKPSTADDGQSKSTYVTYLTPDRDFYNQNNFVLEKTIQKYGREHNIKNVEEANDINYDQYEHTYTLNADLKLPSRKETEEVINDVVIKDKSLYKKAISKYVEFEVPFTLEGIAAKEIGSKSDYDEIVKRRITETLEENKYKSMSEVSAQVSIMFGAMPDVKNKVINELSKRGYNAMTDEAGVGGRFGWKAEGMDPLIVFDKSVLKETRVRSTLSDTFSLEKAQRVQNWQQKAEHYKHQHGNEW